MRPTRPRREPHALTHQKCPVRPFVASCENARLGVSVGCVPAGTLPPDDGIDVGRAFGSDEGGRDALCAGEQSPEEHDPR